MDQNIICQKKQTINNCDINDVQSNMGEKDIQKHSIKKPSIN